MPATYRLAPHLGMPVPVHAQTPAAEAARVAIAGRIAAAKAADAARLVVQHERPAPEAAPANAERLAESARAAGFEVSVTFGWWLVNAGRSNERRAASAQVAGIHRGRRVGFRAVWVEGKATLGLWYDGRDPSRLPADVGVTEVGARV